MNGYRDATLTPEIRQAESDAIEAWTLATELALGSWPAPWRLLACYRHRRALLVMLQAADRASAHLAQLRRKRGLPPLTLSRQVVRARSWLGRSQQSEAT